MMIKLSRQAYSRSIFQITKKELIISVVESVLIISIFGYFFYRSVLITLMAMPLSFIYIQYKKQELCKKKKKEFQLQFKDALESVKISIEAGYSMENAFKEAYVEMYVLYGENAVITKELYKVKMGLNNNKSIISLLYELGSRSEIEDIRDFASVLAIGKQTGGNLNTIIQTYITTFEEKIGVIEEVTTIISSKVYEQKIMNSIPFFIIFYINITTKNYFDCLYNNIVGRLIMTCCLIIYLASVYLSKRAIKIVI